MTYARIARDLGASVVAVADPDRAARARCAQEFGIPDDRTFDDWQGLMGVPRLADAVAVCTQDRDHVGPTVAAAALGYHILLEKPMATDRAGAQAIVDAVAEAGVVSAVCHVLRFTAYTRLVKRLLAEGAVGRVVAVQHLEPVGWWHFAHSFVRGNWRSEAETSPMLLQKAVHDLDWVAHIVGEPVCRVSSFGALTEFRPENRPAGAADRCLDCHMSDQCPYDAGRTYQGFLRSGDYRDWPLTVLTPRPDEASIDQALRGGRYGRCVYAGDNDVVDHQVVSLEFPSGANASLMVVAFTEMANRKTRIFGSHGWLEGDGAHVRVHDFTSDTYTDHDADASDSHAGAGHGGGDEGLVRAFLKAVGQRDPSLVSSDVQASLASLEVAWAAEQARRDGSVVTLPP